MHRKTFILNKFILLAAFFLFILPETGLGIAKNSPVNLENYIYDEMLIPLEYQHLQQPFFVYENVLVEINVSMSSINHSVEWLIKKSLPIGQILKDRIASLNLSEYRLENFESQEEKMALEIMMGENISKGFCKIKEKTHNKLINEIIVKFYKYAPAPLQGEKGEYFYFKSDEIFYKTIGDLYETYDPTNLQDHIYETKEVLIQPQEVETAYFYYENSLVAIKVRLDDMYNQFRCPLGFFCEDFDKKIKALKLKEYRLENFNKAHQYFLQLVIANLMIKGKCLIKEKKNDETVKKIFVDYYNHQCGDLCGVEGRFFRFLSGDIFYQINDKLY